MKEIKSAIDETKKNLYFLLKVEKMFKHISSYKKIKELYEKYLEKVGVYALNQEDGYKIQISKIIPEMNKVRFTQPYTQFFVPYEEIIDRATEMTSENIEWKEDVTMELDGVCFVIEIWVVAEIPQEEYELLDSLGKIEKVLQEERIVRSIVCKGDL